MKLAHFTWVIACALLLSLPSFARDRQKNSGSFDLAMPAQIGAVELQPGHYKVSWQAEQGNSVRLEILQRGKTVATTEAKLKTLAQPSPENSVITKQADQNQNRRKVEEIDFSKSTQALVLPG